MKPQQQPSKPSHQDLFRIELDRLINEAHPLVKLSAQMGWQSLDEHLGTCFCEEGLPGINTRLMVSLHYLQYANNLSDEETLAFWVENPYWQYFGGMIYFQHNLPIHPSSMSLWRTRIGEKGAEQLLRDTIDHALKIKLVKPEQLTRINVDTTVSQNNTAFPTDARLYKRAIDLLVKEAKLDQIVLRRNYRHVSKKTLLQSQRYAHARQMKRAAKQVRKLRTMLGSLIRDIDRKTSGAPSPHMLQVLDKARGLHTQQKSDKNKLYSLHEPDTQCIAKGKIGRKYEFGHQVSVAATRDMAAMRSS